MDGGGEIPGRAGSVGGHGDIDGGVDGGVEVVADDAGHAARGAVGGVGAVGADVAGHGAGVASGDAGGRDGAGGDYDFFVSYTGADAAWAEWIAWRLEEGMRFGDRPARVFVQKWDMVPGTNWAASMHLVLPASARVVPVLSAAYLADSRYGNAEWLAIWPHDPEGRQRLIVPVRIDECRPGGLLHTITYVDLVGRDEAAATATLLSGITAAVAGRAKPAAAPVFPGMLRQAAHGAGRPAFPGPAGAASGSPVPAGSGSVFGSTSGLISRGGSRPSSRQISDLTSGGRSGPAAGSEISSGPSRMRIGGRDDVGAVGAGHPDDSGERVVGAGRRGERRGHGKVGERERDGNPAVTVLHISDTQFGANHVFGEAGLTGADRAHSSLFGGLHDDLRGLAGREGLQPDLVVVTGDLTETADEGEFDQVYDFLVALAEYLGFDRGEGRKKIVLIPDNHDVNRLLCQAYFLQEMAYKREAEPPYWPKWKFFDALLRVGAGLGVVRQHCAVVGCGQRPGTCNHARHSGGMGPHPSGRFIQTSRRTGRLFLVVNQERSFRAWRAGPLRSHRPSPPR